MRRNKDKSPYEVFGKNQLRLHDHQETRILEPIASDLSDSHRSTDLNREDTIDKKVLPKWPRQPKMLILAQSRIQILVSYQLAIAIVLGIILIILLSFRIGQKSQLGPAPSSNTTSDTQTVSSAPSQDFSSATVSPTIASAGQNRIVIQTHNLRSELEPVQHYFAKANIACHLRQIGNRYYLVTDKKYDNPSKKGNDGYIARQKIIEIGRKYAPPVGFKSFGPKAFEDVYGMKFQD